MEDKMTADHVSVTSLFNEMVPSSQSLEAVQSSSVKLLSMLPSKQLRYALPCLSRLCFCTPLDMSSPFSDVIQEIRKLIYAIKATGTLISLMSVDFQVIYGDLMKEKALLRKTNENGLNGKNYNNTGKIYEGGVLLEFERSEPASRVRLVVRELLRLSSVIEGNGNQFSAEFSGLFECAVYLNELSDVICIAMAEMPSLLSVPLLTSVLVRINHGAVILCRLTLNFPTIFEKVCSCIINSCGKNMNVTETKMKEEALILLCQMNPSYVKTLRDDLVNACCLPGLAVILSSNHQTTDENRDLVAFTSGLLFTDNQKGREWFSGFLKQSLSHGVEAMVVFRQQLKTDLIQLTKRINNEYPSTIADMFKAIALLRLYCGLKGIGYKISNDEADLLLNLVTCHPPVSSLGIRFVIVGLCTLLVCSSLVSTQAREEHLTEWLEWLCQIKDEFCKSNTSGTSFGEMLLLIAIHFHSNNLEAIGQLVTTCINIKLRPGSLTKIKILFTQHLFPEKVVAEHALTVQVTNSLSSNKDGYLPIHCVHQLLKSRSFAKNCLNIKSWIYRQLCRASAPLHELLVPLVDAFVHSVVMPLGGNKASRHGVSKPIALEGFSEEELFNIFKQGEKQQSNAEDQVTPRLLFMYYALLYQDTIFRNVRSNGNFTGGLRHYSAALYQEIPMKYLLLKAKTDQTSFGSMYPPLLRLVTTHYPHLCQVEDWVIDEELNNDSTLFNVMSHTINHRLESVEEMKKALHADVFNSASTMIHLSALFQLLPSDLVAYMPVVVGMFPLLLDSDMPRAVQLICCRLWRQLNAVAPNRLWCDTVNVLCQCSNAELASSVKIQPFSEEEITKDPSIVLRCDTRVFRCPPVFDILLTILTSYLAASRAFMQQHLLLNPNSIGSMSSQFVDQEREELKNALIAAQESAVAQMILEICTTDGSDQLSSSQNLIDYTKREISCRVCSYLHQVFISDPNMIKLIHFQGYPPELIEMTVAGIPSMHICLDFIPELLNMPQIEKQVFAVQLFSSLAVQYPLPKAQSIAKYTVSRFTSLVSALSTDRMVEFFAPTAPCLVKICKAFPPLKPQCIEALTRLGRIVSSCLHLRNGDAVYPGIVFKPTAATDQGFEDTVLTDDQANNQTHQSSAISDKPIDVNEIDLYRIIETVLLDISCLDKEK